MILQQVVLLDTSSASARPDLKPADKDAKSVDKLWSNTTSVMHSNENVK
jgi:hypothetical protein